MAFGQEVVVSYTTPSMFSMNSRHCTWEQCGGLIEKHFMCHFLKHHTYFGMSRDAKVSLTLNDPKHVVLLSNSNNTSENAPTFY